MNLPQFILQLPHGAPRSFHHSRCGESKTGRIYHRFFSKQACSCILFFCLTRLPRGANLRFPRVEETCIASNLHLTNFFDLSNIRPFAGGPVKMFGASRCFRKLPFQFDGQPALGADLPFECDPSTLFISHSKKLSWDQRKPRLLPQVGFHSFCGLSARQKLKG